MRLAWPRAPRPLAVALRPLAWRVRTRYLLEWLCLGALLALAGAAPLVLGGRLLGRAEWPLAALIWSALALGGALALAVVRWPSVWTIARAADHLGLAERVTSALHADWSGHPAAPLLLSDAVRSLERVDPADYSLLSQRRRWAGVLLAATAVAVVALAPLPGLGGDGRRSAEARGVAEARRSVEELQARLIKPSTPEPLTQATADELKALQEQLARAATAGEAARTLEQAQERLANHLDAEDYAWRRAMEHLSATWAGQPDLSALARALQSGDPRSVEAALAELAARTDELTAQQLQELQLALQSGANATRDVPALAGALRQAASQIGSATAPLAEGEGAAEAKSDAAAEAAGALQDLTPTLAQGAARAGGLRTAQQALAALGQARAGLGQPGAGATAGGATAGGAPTGSATGGRAAAGSGASSSGSLGSTGGAGSGSGTSSGAGEGSGSAGAVGASGSGGGAGAGSGGGPAPGQPGAGDAGPTTGLGSGAPSQSGTTTYDPIFAPSLLGGEGGPAVQVPGDPAAAGGQTVELPESPLALGAVRPYDQVYGQYESAARQSLTRRSLPPNLQGLVQRYFSAIAPERRGE